MDPTSYVVFVVTSLPWTHGLRTDWFLVRCNFKPDAIFGKCGELALHVFLSLWFSPEALRANFINVTSFLRKVCGPYLVHTAAGRRLAVGVTLSHQELEDRVKKQLQYCIARSWALIDRVEEQIRSIGLQLGRAQEELLPDRRYNWTELVAVWIFSILRSFQLAKALRLRLLAFVKRNFYKARLLLKALVTWLRRPTESWTLGWAIRCFQLRMWTINFYFPMLRKLMETCWRIFLKQKYLRARLWLELWKVMK